MAYVLTFLSHHTKDGKHREVRPILVQNGKAKAGQKFTTPHTTRSKPKGKSTFCSRQRSGKAAAKKCPSDKDPLTPHSCATVFKPTGHNTGVRATNYCRHKTGRWPATSTTTPHNAIKRQKMHRSHDSQRPRLKTTRTRQRRLPRLLTSQ